MEAEEGMRQKALNRIELEKERNPKLRIRKDSKILITASVNIGGDLARESGRRSSSSYTRLTRIFETDSEARTERTS